MNSRLRNLDSSPRYSLDIGSKIRSTVAILALSSSLDMHVNSTTDLKQSISELLTSVFYVEACFLSLISLVPIS